MIPLGSLARGSGAAILNINPTISPPLWQVLAFPAPAIDAIAHQIRASTVDRHDGTAYSPAYTDSNAGLLNPFDSFCNEAA